MPVSLSLLAGAGWQFFDNSGTPLSGGKLYTYVAGTTTPATTYTDATGVQANTNPIILNSAGRVPYEIWLTSGTNYKFILKTSTDTLLGTYDNIRSAATSLDGTGTNNAVAYFNSVGAFSSSSNFTFNDSTNALTVAGNISGNNISAGGNVAASGNLSGVNLTATGTAAITGNTTITGTLAVTGGITSATPAVTQSPNDNSTKIATTAFVQSVTQSSRIQPLTATINSTTHELTVSLAPTSLTFRTNDSNNTVILSNASTLNLTVPAGATLGTVSGKQARLVVLALYNSGNMRLAITNSINNNNLDETNSVTTTTTGSTASAIYSDITSGTVTTYRVVGFIDSTQTTAGQWDSTPTLVQGAGGQSVVKVAAITQMPSQSVAGTTSVSFTDIPKNIRRITIVFNKIVMATATNYLIQIGAGSTTTSGYQSVSAYTGSSSSGSSSTAGFVVHNATSAVFSGTMTLNTTDGYDWVASHSAGFYGVNIYGMVGGGNVTLSGILDRVIFTTVSGAGAPTAGSLTVLYE